MSAPKRLLVPRRNVAPRLRPTRTCCRARRRRRSSSARSKLSKAESIRVDDRQRLPGQHALRRQPDVDGGWRRRTRNVAVAERVRAEARRRHDERPVRRCAPRAPSSSPRRSRKLAPDDPEAMPPLGPQQYTSVDGVLRRRPPTSPPRTARAPRSPRSSPAREAGDLAAAGYHRRQRRSSNAIGNKHGAVRLPPLHDARTTRSPSARPTAPARAGPAPTHQRLVAR